MTELFDTAVYVGSGKLESVEQLIKTIKAKKYILVVPEYVKATVADQLAELTESTDVIFYDVAEDVLKNDANPVEHYVRYGGFEARNPSPHFDSQFYLDSNPDVAEAEMNPLVHYLQYGKEEQRPALPNLSQSQGL